MRLLHRSRYQPTLELLEDRRLLSSDSWWTGIAMLHGELQITSFNGSPAALSVTVTDLGLSNPANPWAHNVRVTANGRTRNFDWVQSIRFSGTGGNDYFVSNVPVRTSANGGAGADTIRSGGGNDFLEGGNANDYIDGGSGNDTIIGGAGNDTLFGGSGNDDLNGELFWIDGKRGAVSADTMDGGAGSDTFDCAGKDNVNGGTDDDWYRVVGNSFQLTLTDSSGRNSLYFMEQTSGIKLSLASTAVQNVLGISTLQFKSIWTLTDLQGTDYADRITGNSLNNRILGGAGNDTIDGGAGDDTILGFSGDDVLHGNDGRDWLYGGNGPYQHWSDPSVADNDYLSGGKDDDHLKGEAGDDTIAFTHLVGGLDAIYGDEGINWLDFRSYSRGVTVDLSVLGEQTVCEGLQRIRLESTSAIDHIFGTKLDDVLKGNSQANELYGSGGHDTLYGRGGADRLYGGIGNDGLYGGPDADLLVGGKDKDRFLTIGTADTISDLMSWDAEVQFANGAKQWMTSEIEQIDAGLKVLHSYTGNTVLLKDPSWGTLRFVREGHNATASADNPLESRDINIYNGALASPDWARETTVHEIMHSWHGVPLGHRSESAVTNMWNSFLAISGWTHNDLGAGYTRGKDRDEVWYYRTNAEFASRNTYYSQTNPYEDMATSFEVFFFGSAAERAEIPRKLTIIEVFLTHISNLT